MVAVSIRTADSESLFGQHLGSTCHVAHDPPRRSPGLCCQRAVLASTVLLASVVVACTQGAAAFHTGGASSALHRSLGACAAAIPQSGAGVRRGCLLEPFRLRRYKRKATSGLAMMLDPSVGAALPQGAAMYLAVAGSITIQIYMHASC